MITATLTRPTTISPTTTCDRKVNLIEKVDIGPLDVPRPRTIYLEPISKKSRKRKTVAPVDKPPAPSDAVDPNSDVELPEPSPLLEDPPAASDDAQISAAAAPRSPIQSDLRSEFSGDSAVSTSTGMSVRASDVTAAPNAGIAPPTSAKLPIVEDKTITATIELLKGGCLPGDMVPVKISVQHIKRIKSMHGVIVTMFRQGRIDPAPPVSSFANGVSKSELRRMEEKDDFYPKSRTGLGGLSLTSTTSLSVFRKDLSQVTAPLIIDPHTLHTTVTTSVKVPEDAFPTIKGVPGDMISFKYQLEVLVDLGGRLASQLGQATRVGSVTVPGAGSDAAPGAATSWGGNVVDTDRLRREKGVISVVFEVIVGTVDSTRGRGRGGTRSIQISVPPLSQDDGWYPEQSDFDELSPYPQIDTSYPPPPMTRQTTFTQTIEPSTTDLLIPAPAYIPPPETPEENGLSEKERVRRQEERLLPSRPPNLQASSPLVPSAPNIYDSEDGPSTSNPPAPLSPGVEASAPTLDDIAAASASQATEDKQELERQRLLAEASAPPEFPEDYDGPGEGSSSPRLPRGVDLEPSAPALDDDDDYESHIYQTVAGPSGVTHRNTSEPLPKYER
jgi:arrestin-related trafficking adapter 9